MAHRVSQSRGSGNAHFEGTSSLPARDSVTVELPSRSRYASLIKGVLYYLGTRYRVSPKNVEEGIRICRELDEHQIPSTLGDFSSPSCAPSRITKELRFASDSLKNAHADTGFYLTLKPPRLDFDLENVAAVVSTALANGHGIHLDSHQHDVQDPTLTLLEALMENQSETGGPARRWRFSLTVPSRWKRSLRDADWLAERAIRVRLVKGEFKAPSSSHEADPRDNFLTLVDRLAGRVPEIAIATHDRSLAREAVIRARALGSPVEIEVLFGIPAGDMLSLARELAVPVRFYVPYGDTILMYGVQHLLTHPHKLLRPGSRDLIRGCRGKVADIIEALTT